MASRPRGAAGLASTPAQDELAELGWLVQEFGDGVVVVGGTDCDVGAGGVAGTLPIALLAGTTTAAGSSRPAPQAIVDDLAEIPGLVDS